ncbi:hypothetical protein I5907_08155 [Panacibacter sp. DH6]|uniref:Uncharacterized protein n=1 Tax=Panacibacter microcysteis TaxID=2793269 RepID=A0A931E6S4_9BACT|nr:hypothetical protein [Panacibacter microcysteis]MBG9376204.1 hypothetical protein [Panacibacter microcysteis]
MKRKLMSAVLIAATIAVLTPAVSQANDNKNATIEILSTENTTSVQFAGSTDNALLFDVKINNPKADKFTLFIQSADGEVLFSQVYSDVNFSKKVKLLKGSDNSSYRFTIKSSNKSLENSFVVNAATKTVDDVVVTKL